MRAVDAASPDSLEVLVGRAGAAVARAARRMMGGTYGRVVDVIAGPGNNGADGRVAAEVLRASGVTVRVFSVADAPRRLPPADLVIDAAYGTGFRDQWSPPAIGGTPVLAVDIPSGVDGLTGAAAGVVWPAAVTVTFAALKPGLLFGDGKALAGRVELADIGLDVTGAGTHLVEADDVRQWWHPRRPTDHKWKASVRVIAGSAGMTGAAHLVCTAAMRAGAGMVALSVPGATGGGATGEVVGRPLAEREWAVDAAADLDRFGALVVGPGLGRHPATAEQVREAVARAGVPVVADADAIVAFAGAPEQLRRRRAPTVLTPHDGELASLTGAPVAGDRIEAARRVAAETGAVVLLKGVSTVVADPGGVVRVVANGDERLATAGSGDVLSGIIGAMLAGGLGPLDAAAVGAWVHAAAASLLPRHGMLAGDLPGTLPAVFEDLAS
jgi:NAD(P)H-hydrate epimerase